MVGWHHQFNGYELGQTLKDGEGTGRHAMLQSMGLHVRHTWQLNNKNILTHYKMPYMGNFQERNALSKRTYMDETIN